MNARIKEEWVGALRSGKYKQGEAALRRETDEETEFCCLGVLCELYRQENPSLEWISHPYQSGRTQLLNNAMVLPDAVEKWAELNGADPEIATTETEGIENVFEEGHITLAKLNDWGKDFEYIADLIEEEL